MAVDMLLDLTAGDIKGETQIDGYDDQIDILAWSWGMSQSGTTHMGSGGGSGKVNVQDLSFTKYIDSSSHALMQKCCTGEHIPSATLKVRKAGGSKALEYIIIELTDIIVGSVSTGGSGGEDRLTENITLNFAEFTYSYTPQNEDGSKGAKKNVGFNIAKNVLSG